MSNFSTISWDSIQKGVVSFEQRVFEVKSMIQGHTQATLREGIVWSLSGATADLVQYLGLQTPVSETVSKLEGALNVVQQEYPMMLSMSEVQNHLRDDLFHRLHKQLYDSMHYLYDDVRIMYPQLVTAPHKAE